MISSDWRQPRALSNLTLAAANKSGLELGLSHECTQRCRANSSPLLLPMEPPSRIFDKKLPAIHEQRGRTDVRPRPNCLFYWTVIVTGAVWLSAADLPVTISVTCCCVTI